MKIVILGAGDSGSFLATKLSKRRHSITVIDKSEDLIAALAESTDVAVICGNGTDPTILAEAEAATADLFVALTSDDNANLLAASVAKGMGANRALARIHASIQHGQWLFDYREHFGIDYLFSTERLTALEILRLIRDPDAPVTQTLGKGKIEIHTLVIPRSSDDIDRPIRELALPKQVRIATLQRADRTLLPTGEDALRSGDQITLVGNPSEASIVAERLGNRSPARKRTRITIFGGGEYGFALALLVDNPRFHARILEVDRKQCEALSKRLTHGVVINGDARSAQVLKEEQIDQTDYFIATTPDDEDNLMTCLQARNLGAKHAIPIIHRADYTHVVQNNRDRLGLLATVSPRVATLQDLIRFVESDDLHSLGFLAPDAELVQFTLGPDSHLTGKTAQAVSWPPGSSLVACVREESVRMNPKDMQLERGDLLYAVVLAKAKPALLTFLAR